MSADPVVALRGVSFSYPLPGGGVREVLRDLSLEVFPGETLVVLGASGAGKSALAALLAGAARPGGGAVLRTPAPEGAAVLPAGLVTENPEDSFTSTTVREEVGVVLENLGRDPLSADAAVRAMLEQIGLSGHAGANPERLSGGQKQLLAIAAVLVADPPLLVLDDPLSLLDGPGREEVAALLSAGGRGRATVLLTAEVESARRGSRVAVLHGGTVAWEGPPADLPADGAALAGWGLLPTDLSILGAGLRAAGLRVSPPDTDPERMAGALPVPSAVGAPGLPPAARAGGAEAVRAPALAVEGVHFAYDPGSPQERPVLRGIDLEARPGEVLGVIGPIGSGKTTLLRHLNGLLLPQRGRVRVGGRTIEPGTKLERLLHRELGLVFQFPEKQLFAESVTADVAAGLEFADAPPAEIGGRVAAALAQVGLDPGSDGPRSPFELSWGEQRLAAIAGVLVLDNPCIAFDEPGAGLDPAGRRRIMGLIADLAHREGRTVLVVSHHLDDLFRVADRIAVLSGGRIVWRGTFSELCAGGDLDRWGLGFPALTRFARASRGAVATDVRSPEEALRTLRLG